jgi:hypothetical protein
MREVLNMCVSISSMEAMEARDPKMIEYLVHDKIRRGIADKVASVATVETKYEFHTEYRCRVIVADHDDYWRDVREAAERLGYSSASPMFIEEGLK